MIWLSENPGALPVLGFVVLLVLAAAYLAAGDEPTANRLAETAYYLLVAGVAAELATLAVEQRIKREVRVRVCVGRRCAVLLSLKPSPEPGNQ